MKKRAGAYAKDGSRFWADIVLTAVRDTTGELTGFAKVTRDFTDRKRAEEAVMLQLSQALLANMDVRKLLGGNFGKCARGGTARLRHAWTRTTTASRTLDGAVSWRRREAIFERRYVRLPLDGSPAGEAFQTREPVIIERIQTSRLSAERRSTSHLPRHAIRLLDTPDPSRRGDRHAGRCQPASKNAFTQRETEMLVQVADQVAMAVSNAMVFRQIAELRDRLRQEKQYLEGGDQPRESI